MRGGMSKGGAKDPNSANKLETRQRLRERAQTKLSEKQRKAPVKSKENKGCKKKKEKPHEELPFKGSGSKITQRSSKRQTGSTGRGATPALDWRRWRCRKAVV